MVLPEGQDYWTANSENIKLIIGEDIPFSPNLYIQGDHLSTSDADWIQTVLMSEKFWFESGNLLSAGDGGRL